MGGVGGEVALTRAVRIYQVGKKRHEDLSGGKAEKLRMLGWLGLGPDTTTDGRTEIKGSGGGGGRGGGEGALTRPRTDGRTELKGSEL